MGWWLIAVEAPAPVTGGDGGSQSLTVALIGTLGTVVVALLTLVGNWLANKARTSNSPPDPDARIGERIAVAEVRVQDSSRTLDVLDRHVDNLGDLVDRLTWRLDDLTARVEDHNRRHP